MNLKDIKFDCRHFRGDIPCVPNKVRGKVCTCDEYSPVTKKILLIKLGAIGDVIRSTPLVSRFRKEFPGCHITWLTLYPDILPKDSIDKVLKFEFKNVFNVSKQNFDLAINLDKDNEACILLKEVDATEKLGFIWNDNHIDIANPEAEHKLMTGFFDQLSQQNTKSYPEEIFEICKLKYEHEPYLINLSQSYSEKWNILRTKAQGKKIIGLNTGCGKRWSTRLWPTPYWITLIKRLQKTGYYPVLLGGEDEDEQNKIYAYETGAYYPGTFSLAEFIGLTNNCDTIVTAVSMMMHIAIALKKPMILFNNIFNKYEFELFGRGEIIEPPTGCDCYYGNICTRERHCMIDILPETVFSAVERHTLLAEKIS